MAIPSGSTWAAAGLSLVLAATATGCWGEVGGTTGPQSHNEAAAELLNALGAERIYLMAGEDSLRAGIGVLDEHGLKPLRMEPDPALISNISGNGTDIVIGAAGVPKAGDDEGEGFLTDAVYRLAGNNLEALAGPDEELYGPTISSAGTVAAIQPLRGFATLEPDAKEWLHDRRLSRAALSALSWASTGEAVSVLNADGPNARLVAIPPQGRVTRLSPAHCASAVLAAPSDKILVTSPSTRAKVRANSAGCDRAYVMSLDGQDLRAVPSGWTPLGWAADSSAVLLSRGAEMAAWSLDGAFIARADVGARTWMAASVYFE